MRVWVLERVFVAEGPLKDGSDVVSVHKSEISADDLAYSLQQVEYRKEEAEYMYNVYPVELLA